MSNDQVEKGNRLPHSDLKRLNQLIEWPFFPIKGVWQTRELSDDPKTSFLGSKDWALIALLTFKPEHFQTLLKQSPQHRLQPQNLRSPFVFDWFPKEVTQKLSFEDSTQSYHWHIQAREVQLFAKSPLLHGYWIPFEESNQIFIYLQTM